MTRLTNATLTALGPAVARPGYDRGRARAGIVHIGVGAFHRAHQAMYLDRVLAAGEHEWGICGVGLRPQDAPIRDALARQDNLYTLVTREPDGSGSARVIGSIVRYCYGPDDPGAVLGALASPETRIVSLTITEGGYEVDDATGEFRPHEEATLHDLAELGRPRGALGYLTAALARRRAAGLPPFTVLSCDNVRNNGAVARTALVGFADRHDPGLARWIEAEAAFPNTMVDRITPATTPEVIATVREEFGVEDLCPVQAESFEQWVIEDSFPLGRPALDLAGAQVVDDVEPYELMKLRLLNASHQAMSYLGILAGYTYVHEACADPVLAGFLMDYMRKDATPTLRPVPGIDLDAYCHRLLARFRSRAISDTLARQVVDASDRIPTFLLPVARERLAHGDAVDRVALVVAAWCAYLDSAGRDGRAVQDKRAARLFELAARDRAEPGAFLDDTGVFAGLGSHPGFREAYLTARSRLADIGPLGAAATTSAGTG